MIMDTLAKQSLEAAMEITGTNGKDEHTQNIAFMLACAEAAHELGLKQTLNQKQ